MKQSLLALAFALAACSDNKPTPSPVPPPPPPTPGSPWQVTISKPPISIQVVNDLPRFNFPQCTDPTQCSVGYVEQPWSALPGKQSVTLSYTIEGNNPIFSSLTNPNNTCPPSQMLALLLHRAGDNWSYPYYRWYSKPESQLALGSATLTVPLDISNWLPVQGPSSPADYEAALANIGSVGFVLGGGCFKGHGVAVTQGSASLTINEFRVN